MEPVSPELVLVDPELAGRARSRLSPPVDTMARVDALVLASRRSSLALRSAEISRHSAPLVVEPRPRVARNRPRRSAAIAGAVAAGTLAVALLVGIRIELGGTPAGADTTVSDRAPATSAPETPSAGAKTLPAPVPPRPAGAKTLPAPVPPRPASNPRPQRFAWAPTAGASAYHVELFLGSSRVFEADTKRPTLTIPARWTSGGRTRSLQPAEYRWYVWPVVSGQRAAEAIVQATLTVPPR